MHNILFAILYICIQKKYSAAKKKVSYEASDLCLTFQHDYIQDNVGVPIEGHYNSKDTVQSLAHQ